jgi:AhpD family alkylhydroperoxidase
MERAEFKEIAPAADAALIALGQAAAAAGIEKDLLELVKLRASQINGCAFCIQFHLNIARQLGIAPEKLDLVVAWREAGVFSAREQAALSWTEALTAIAGRILDDAAYEAALAHFSKAELAFLTAAIGAVNVWNRIAVAFRFTPPVPR